MNQLSQKLQIYLEGDNRSTAQLIAQLYTHLTKRKPKELENVRILVLSTVQCFQSFQVSECTCMCTLRNCIFTPFVYFYIRAHVCFQYFVPECAHGSVYSFTKRVSYCAGVFFPSLVEGIPRSPAALCCSHAAAALL